MFLGLRSFTETLAFVVIVTNYYESLIYDNRSSKVRFPAGAWNFSLHHRAQKGSGAHPASYPMGARGSFPGGKAAGG
jgi:hypothetical protein